MQLRTSLFLIVLISFQVSIAQKINWTSDGLAFTRVKEGNIIRVDPKSGDETVLIKKELLTPDGTTALKPQSYEYSTDNSKMLVFTNTVKVWRFNTRGDYWLVDISGNKLKQIGKSMPPQSLMFAKLSPDGKNIAYVSGNNI